MNVFQKSLLAGTIAMSLTATAIAADRMPCEPMEAMQGYGQGYGPQMGRMDPAKRAEWMKAHMARRHQAVRDKLKLSAEQEAGWNAYIAGTNPPARGMPMDRAEMMKLPAPERMEKMLERMKERQAYMTARLVELKKFYATLTPEQQKIFDAEMMGPRGARMGGQGRRGSQGPGMGRGMGAGAGSTPASAAP